MLSLKNQVYDWKGNSEPLGNPRNKMLECNPVPDTCPASSRFGGTGDKTLHFSF